jgi:hypothetical protein
MRLCSCAVVHGWVSGSPSPSVSIEMALLLVCQFASARRSVSMSCQIWPSADPERRPRMKWLSIPVVSWKYHQAPIADPTIE